MHEGYFNVLTAVSHATIIVKIILLILILLSIYSWGIILNKFRVVKSKAKLLNNLRKLLKNKQYDYAQLLSSFQKYNNNSYTNLLTFLENNKEFLVVNGTLNQPIADSVYNLLYDINSGLDKKLTTLATIGNSSPFIGLLGTVIGIINSFESIGATASASLAVIAPGVAEALYATAVGLFVAVPAVFAYNHFVTKIEEFKDQQSIFTQDLIFYFIKNNAVYDNKSEPSPVVSTNKQSKQSPYTLNQADIEATALSLQEVDTKSLSDDKPLKKKPSIAKSLEEEKMSRTQ